MGIPFIIIDAGHGGDDPGATRTLRVIEEEDTTLDISLYQRDRFEALGVPTALTRVDDTTVEPEPRAQKVRESGAKICISNHINAGGGTGAEVIVSLFSDKVWGSLVLSALKEAGAGSRKVYSREHPTIKGKDYYFMHRRTGRVETLIVEYGFIDSADIKGLLENWKRYAEAAVKATCEYIGVEYQPPADWSTAPQKPAWPWGIPSNAEEFMVNGFRDLVDAGLIKSPEAWGPKLMEPAPLWFLTTVLANSLRKGNQ